MCAACPTHSCFGMLGSLLFGIVLFFLLAAQTGSRYVQTDIVEVKHYDTTYYPRVLIFSIMVIALFFSALSICCIHLEVPLYVSDHTYHFEFQMSDQICVSLDS
jgi:ammonia channel protein AmtB